MAPDSTQGQQPESTDGGSLADMVAAHIRNRIAGGRFRQGDRIKEQEIATELGVSRGPVREAINRLSGSRLLVTRRNAGVHVALIDADLVHMTYDVRVTLESLAARRAAERMDTAQREALMALIERQEREFSDDRADSYAGSDADWAFHFHLLDACDNDIVRRICGTEVRDLMSLMSTQIAQSLERGHRALLEHRWIAEAVVAGETELAASLMGYHIQSSRAGVLHRLRRPERPS